MALNLTQVLPSSINSASHTLLCIKAPANWNCRIDVWNIYLNITEKHLWLKLWLWLGNRAVLQVESLTRGKRLLSLQMHPGMHTDFPFLFFIIMMLSGHSVLQIFLGPCEFSSLVGSRPTTSWPFRSTLRTFTFKILQMKQEKTHDPFGWGSVKYSIYGFYGKSNSRSSKGRSRTNIQTWSLGFVCVCSRWKISPFSLTRQLSLNPEKPFSSSFACNWKQMLVGPK